MGKERHRELRERALKGGTRYLPKLREQNKLTARERLDLLLDRDSLVEDGLFANVLADELPADGVIPGLGLIDGRQVAVMANDPTVKAGSWGARTVEKIVRIQEAAARICKLKPEDLDRSTPFFAGPTPIRDILWNAILAHGIHHRGQLSTYLRAMGAKVPSIYGGSADERPKA